MNLKLMNAALGQWTWSHFFTSLIKLIKDELKTYECRTWTMDMESLFTSYFIKT